MHPSEADIAVIPFRIDSNFFGIPCQFVVRVLPSVLPVAVPGVPAAFDGVVNINGRLIVQFNLALALGLVSPPLHQWRPLLWINTTHREIVIPVDEVLPVRNIGLESIVPKDEVDMPLPYSHGVVRLGSEMLLLQDPELFISVAHEISLNEALKLLVQ